MSVKVKGVPIRTEELNYDLEVSFKDLNVEGQKRLLMENKDLFIFEALKSKYDIVKELAHNNVIYCSQEALNKLIISFVNSPSVCNVDLILKILNIPCFTLEYDTRVKLSMSYYYPLKQWVAEDPNTPFDLLCAMFVSAISDVFFYRTFVIFDAIVNNTTFEICEELQHIINYIYEKHHSKDIRSTHLYDDISEFSETLNKISKILNLQ